MVAGHFAAFAAVAYPSRLDNVVCNTEVGGGAAVCLGQQIRREAAVCGASVREVLFAADPGRSARTGQCTRGFPVGVNEWQGLRWLPAAQSLASDVLFSGAGKQEASGAKSSQRSQQAMHKRVNALGCA